MLIDDNVLPAERIGNRHRLLLDAVLSCREERRTRQYDALAATADIDRDDHPETSESNYAKHEALWRRTETSRRAERGQIGGGRSKTTRIIDIALLPTLARRDNIEDLIAGYGFVVADECHHIAASAFFHVLNRIPAKYWLGLTATPERRDGLEDLIYHQLGSHHVTLEGPTAGQLPSAGTDLLAPNPLLHVHPTQFRYTGEADPSAPGGMAEIYRALIADETRLEQIIADVLSAHADGANILILTTWIDHLNLIADRLRKAGKDVVVLSGQMKARERREISEQLANHTAEAGPLLIVGTSSFIGEGFDCPALDTLFLAAPITRTDSSNTSGASPGHTPPRPPQPCTTITTNSLR